MPTLFIANPSQSYTQLLSLISATRKKMIESALSSGFTSPITVQYSQQLDFYLNLELQQRKI
jgi:hypothetical protein